MSFKNFTLFLLVVYLLGSACNSASPYQESTATQEEQSSGLPTPMIQVTNIPAPEVTAKRFLDAWKVESYENMYSLLSVDGQKSINQEDFQKKYREFADELALSKLDYSIQSTEKDPRSAVVNSEVKYQSSMVGNIERGLEMNMVFENGQWRIKWDDSLIMPELAGGNSLRMEIESPERKPIYDRNGNPLAYLAEAISIGIYPDFINLEEDSGLISLLASVTGLRNTYIRQLIEGAVPGDYIALSEIPAEGNTPRANSLAGIGSVVTSFYQSRYYDGGGIGSHVIGYTSQIQEDELSEFRRKGYRSDEYIGRKGIENWGEQTLMGKHGGILYVVDPQGKLIGQLGASPSEPGQPIYTTLDRDLQAATQRAIEGFRGAVVVLEQDTGRVLAMASSPGYDSNAYQTNNYNWSALLGDIVNDPNLPQINRAAEGVYPLGSVFKLVTIAAALESGLFTPESTYECEYFFNELPGLTLNDWTYDFFLEDGETEPSGLLTLPQGLIRSCNPWFWHIGLELYKAGQTTAISDMARAFGLGAKTGVEGIDEEAGKVPDPQNQVDATNLAIGQGDLQVTPLQVARFLAAIGNGGTLYRPQVIERIGDTDASASFRFEPEIQGQLPIKPENLQIIRDAMLGVITSTDPLGTARRAFTGLDVNVYGKTGTAELGPVDPHAWFAGFTDENQENRPDIAVVVLVENAGQGSEVAAPIFRRVVEEYFFDRPIKLYPWEAAINVTKTPTPLYTETPTPEVTP